MPESYILIIFCIIAALTYVNLTLELRRDLMMLQQNSYRRDRYMRWLSLSGDTTEPIRLIGLLAVGINFAPFTSPEVGMTIIGVFSLFSLIKLLKAKYKKPLVMTARARRIYIVAVLLPLIAAIATMLITIGKWEGFAQISTLVFGVCYFASHSIILIANALLSPIDKAINRHYIKQAKHILQQMPDLKIIGITGSYGKTTTKHYLQRILSEKFETLMTPGSYNTTLGVVRTIREMLKPYHEVFVVEMGAKAVGDIKEICDIVHPQTGIISAVGAQHLESFKSIENVQATKFELSDALPSDGLIVVNNDFEKIADRKVSNCKSLRYAVKNITTDVDYIATDVEYTPSGTYFTARCQRDNWELRLHTPLVGECNISNVLAAVIIARNMGVSENSISYAVEQLEQVEHRLSIKRIPGGLTIIDDAFNSNPVGSAMALDVLAAMTQGKRILITPGMIELGEQQFDLNAEFGKKAATSADIVIVVGHYNRDAIVNGLHEGKIDKKSIYLADSFAHAQQILASISAAGDTVLYENDLPDTFK